MIKVKCPRCHKVLNVSEQDVGSTGHCTQCKGHIAILDALEPTPHQEAPPAPLVTDEGFAEWRAILRDPKAALGQGQVKSGVKATSLAHHCLTSVLINLNQLVYLFRYKRNEIPDTKEFFPQREERQQWEAELGTFGLVVLDNNIQRRIDNIEDALKGLTHEQFIPLKRQLQPLLLAPDRVATKDLITFINAIKKTLLAVEQKDAAYEFQRSAK